MNLSWIDYYADGIMEYCNSKELLHIYNALGIKIIKTYKEDSVLRGGEAIYIRNYFDTEIVFIRDDLPLPFEKFVLSHELGHAILHIDVASVAFNNTLLNKGKLERQADYFALRLLGIDVDKVSYEGCSYEQIAKDLYVREESIEYMDYIFFNH